MHVLNFGKSLLTDIRNLNAPLWQIRAGADKQPKTTVESFLTGGMNPDTVLSRRFIFVGVQCEGGTSVSHTLTLSQCHRLRNGHTIAQSVMRKTKKRIHVPIGLPPTPPPVPLKEESIAANQAEDYRLFQSIPPVASLQNINHSLTSALSGDRKVHDGETEVDNRPESVTSRS